MTSSCEQRGQPTIGPDTPLRLREAAAIAFPVDAAGKPTMTAAGLRREAQRGRLVIERIAGKDFVTLAAIEQMRKLCRVQAKAPDCGSSLKSATKSGSSFGARPGSYEMDRAKSARAALEKTARELSARSENTSPRNTKSQGIATVTPLKSSSRTY
jgi:hypothetical protein